MSTKRNFYYKLCGALFFISIIFYTFYHEYLIFNFKKTIATQYLSETSAKQNVTLFWNKNGWHTEVVQLLLNQNISHDAQLILGTWLESALDERVIKKKIGIQSILASSDQHMMYISFDHIPFGKEDTIFEKWMLIEGIIKTIANSFPQIKQITFLINHQPLIDAHLDFSNPWPVEGFSY